MYRVKVILFLPRRPEDSQTEELDLEIGDIIVMASDGFFDNLFDEDILKILSHVKVSFSLIHNPMIHSCIINLRSFSLYPKA